jgi:putative DNA primase/helicase
VRVRLKGINTVHKRLAEIIQGLAKEFLQKEVSDLRYPSKSCLSRARINATVELSRKAMDIPSDDIGQDRNLMGCADGTILNLQSGRLTINTCGFITKRIGTALDNDAQCPLWTAFLNRIFDHDEDLIHFIQRATGYTLTGSVQEQCLFICIGTGSNGKSTFLRTLHHLFGDYAASIPMQTLMEQKFAGSQQTNDLAYLVGKRFVTGV